MQPSVLILPGYQGSGETHWQTLWEKENASFMRVEQRDWERPNAKEWVSKLEETLQHCDKPVILVAHSIACLVVAHWAAQEHRPIKGALIVAPPNPEESLFPSTAEGFDQTPMERFNFPSILLASSNDPYASFAYSQRLAKAWGSKLIDMGKCGHLNTESNLGKWEDGYVYLQSLLASHS